MATAVGSSDRAVDRAGRTLVQAGWAAKGVVYLSLAWLVLQLARGGASEEVSATGALELIRSSSWGGPLLVLLGVGLLIYAGGMILEVTALATSEIDVSDKAQAAVMSVVYVALAVTTFSVAAGGGGGGRGGGADEEQGAAVLLNLPLGRFLVGALGVAGLALGAYAAYQGLKREFLPTLRTGEMSATMRAWSERLGEVAYVTKGAIFALVGWFLLQAALTYDAQEAVGLDGALHRVAAAGWGRAILLAVSVGLLAYGLFCWVEARYRRVGTSAGGTA
ncbi:DUF1206 domain-containing protein [soil metagenome]